MFRIPIEGVTTGYGSGQAIVIIPRVLMLPPRMSTVDVLFHLHGHNIGYREPGRPGAPAGRGAPRDIDIDRIEQQLEGSGRPIVAILPQGSEGSVFGRGGEPAVDIDGYIQQVFGLLRRDPWPEAPSPGGVMLSGHSGAGGPISELMSETGQPRLPRELGEVALYDAINGWEQLQKVENWVLLQLERDLSVLTRPLIHEEQQLNYLRASLRFRAYHTRIQYYLATHEALDGTLVRWFSDHATQLGGRDSAVYQALEKNYRVIDAGHSDHDALIGRTGRVEGRTDLLGDALALLPAASPDARAAQPEGNQLTVPSQPLQRSPRDARSHHEPAPASRGALSIQRQPAPEPATAAPQQPAHQQHAPALSQLEMDRIATEEIISLLQAFQHIPIEVAELLPQGATGTPRSVTIHVHAAYYINTLNARDRVEHDRAAAHFPAIVRALNATFSVLHGQHPRSQGLAIEYGKGDPSDVRAFVEQALQAGSIRSYAQHHPVAHPYLAADSPGTHPQLIDLPPTTLTAIVQEWIDSTGVGVDCSGFVQQAAIRARDAARAHGMAQLPEISHAERSAASFAEGPAIQTPANLHPLDTWVVENGQHIRIVTAVRPGANSVEFDTSESSGTSHQPGPGPVLRTWRTHDATHFHPVVRVDGTGGAVGGSFHRVQP